MNKYMKAIGKGFIAGVRHPIMEGFPIDLDEMDAGEALLYGTSMGFTQGTIQNGVAIIITIGVLVGIGYLNSKIEKMPVKVEMVAKE